MNTYLEVHFSLYPRAIFTSFQVAFEMKTEKGWSQVVAVVTLMILIAAAEEFFSKGEKQDKAKTGMYWHHLTAYHCERRIAFLEGILSLKPCASLPWYCASNLQYSPEGKPFLTFSPVAGNGREDLLKPAPLRYQLHSASLAETASSRDTAEGQRITTENNCTGG